MNLAQENDPGRVAGELEREGGELGQRGEALEEKVIEVRRDWDRKRADPSVPLAVGVQGVSWL